MTEENKYYNMEKYIESVYTVFLTFRNTAEKKNDRKMQVISLIIYNYVNKLAKEHEINLKELKIQLESINLIPIFEYISYNNIELYDFSKIDMSDVDTNKESDLERFVLTHIYYITQQMR